MDLQNKSQGIATGHRVSLTRWLILRFTDQTKPDREVSDPRIRTQYAFLEATVSIAGNLILAAIKVIMGLVLNSISLLADAAHTAADVLTSVVVLVGFQLAKAPPDEKHPFGHGRVEFLSTLMIAILLGVVGVQFGLSSYGRLRNAAEVKGSFAVALIMLAGAVVKEWMTGFAIFLGKKADAQALIGDAWHHRTDAIASALVSAAIIASGYGHFWVDAVLGLMVSVLILYTGIDLGLSAGSSLIGEQASPALLQEINQVAMGCKGVKGLHRVLVHDYGGRKSVSLHITVEDGLSLSASHDIATEVERSISSRVHGDIVVHVEPQEDSFDSAT